MHIIYPMDCNGSAHAITCKYVISQTIKNPYKISLKSTVFPYCYCFDFSTKGDYPMLMTLPYFKSS